MFVLNTFLLTFPAYAWDARRSAGRSARRSARLPAGRLAGRSLAAPVSSAAPKKKSFDWGGPVWPPWSKNAADDRLGVGLGGLCPPAKNRGVLGGSAPQPKTKNFEFPRNCFLGKAPPRKAVNSMLTTVFSTPSFDICWRRATASSHCSLSSVALSTPLHVMDSAWNPTDQFFFDLQNFLIKFF